MKLNSLRYFAVLAEELHFGRAADRLAITQPPLSLAIKALEEELGVRLLLRSSKHVELTPAGSAFLEEARQILDRVARASSIALAVASGSRGRLDVGMAGSLVYRGVPAIVQRFDTDAHGIELILHEMSTAEQLQGLLHGQLDAGFLNAFVVPPQLRSLPLVDDEFVLCLPAAHRYAGAKAVDLGDLCEERFVMFSREVSPANYDNVIAIFSRAGVHPKTVHAARQWLTIVAMVAEGLGVSLVPRSLARSRVDNVRFVPFTGASAITPALLVWNPARTSPALEKFIASAGSTIAGLREPMLPLPMPGRKQQQGRRNLIKRPPQR
ncbi:LysR family transcriptional regulator [Variovorax saccharolyticus]|uniref:LysR family transcriptional regulator n=1 Tax=Variovorax saccharolyticus TaxID=3053516 RepID=UPI002578E29B|nr:LysR family transcriptional regulator [Variovorax sp. J22R187]MDM0016649.1 LysR family transcriptional regulator [Variovorax sp. J22R187]